MSEVSMAFLSDLIDDIRSGFASGQEDPGGVFQIRMNNITRDGVFDMSRRRYVPNDKKVTEGTLLRAGDVIFNMTNSPDLVGKTAIFPGLRESAAYSNHFLRIRANEKVLRSDYLARWLQLQFKRGVFKSMSRQWVNQATVSKDSLLGLSIPLVSLEMQRKASKTLDLVDVLRAKRRAAITLLEDLAQSIFLDMFGRPLANDRNWPVQKVSELVDRFESGKNISPGQEDGSSKYRVLKVSAVTTGVFDSSESKPAPVDYVPPDSHIVRDGDLLFSRANTSELIGATAFARNPDGNLLLPDKVWRFAWRTPMRVNPIFVHHLFRQPDFRKEISRRATGSSGSMKNISQAKVQEISIGVPSLDLQEDFAERVQALNVIEQRCSQQLAQLDDLFGSLQQRAFRGELWDA